MILGDVRVIADRTGVCSLVAVEETGGVYLHLYGVLHTNSKSLNRVLGGGCSGV